MKNIKFCTLLLATALSLLLLGCQGNKESASSDTNASTLFQYSTLATLLQGVYDGEMSVKELKEHGNFGLGTFNRLDGEMVLLDNHLYQIASDGIAREMSSDTKMPFAAVTHFSAENTFSLSESMDCSALKSYIDKRIPTQNIAYAIKIEGLFSYLKTRSVAKQSKPYPPLAKAIEKEAIFEFAMQHGTIVGFRLPSYMATANAAGYHLHFLSAAKNSGGHLLECQVQDVKISIDYIHKWETILPSDSAFYEANITNERYQ